MNGYCDACCNLFCRCPGARKYMPAGQAGYARVLELTPSAPRVYPTNYFDKTNPLEGSP